MNLEILDHINDGSVDALSGAANKINYNFSGLYSGFFFNKESRGVTGEVWIGIRSDGLSGSGTFENPYNGYNDTMFDDHMNLIPPSTFIHILPGHYRTKGYKPGTGNRGYEIKNGWVVKGAGIDNTIIQLVSGHETGVHFFAFSHQTTQHYDGVHFSDLTIDCNSTGQEIDNVACSAISIYGTNNTIERCKAINMGTQTFPTSTEVFCFAISKSNTNNLCKNLKIKDSICILPSDNQSYTITLFHIGGSIDDTKKLFFAENPLIKNCYCNMRTIDNQYPRLFSAEDRKILISGSTNNFTGIVKTLEPHEYHVNQKIRIRNVTGSLEGGSSDAAKINGYHTVTKIPDNKTIHFSITGNPVGGSGLGNVAIGYNIHALSMGLCKNGRTDNNIVMDSMVGGPYQDTWVTDSINITDNYYHNVSFGPQISLGSLIEGSSISNITKNGTTATMVTNYHHNVAKGSAIYIQDCSPSEYNGSFEVVDAPDDFTLKYVMSSDPGSDATGLGTFYMYAHLGDTVCRKNIIEMWPFKTNVASVGVGIQFTDNAIFPNPPMSSRSIKVQNNIISYVSGRQGENFIALGVDVSSSNTYICQNNIISIDSTSDDRAREKYILANGGSGIYLNNYNLSGQRVTGKQSILSASILDF